jgi:thioredoxin-like negative regulator of GroEL
MGTPVSEAAAPTSTLEHRLRSSADLAHQRVRAEAWEWFREGEFRRAARGFETAVSLEPADAESRIGELFSYVSVGAMRTALVVLRELKRHDDDPFLHDLNLTDAYGDPAQAQRLRLGLPLRAMVHSANPDARALYVLVLWYLGEHEEAIIGAAKLVREFPAGAYADWPTKMRAARASPAAEKGPSQP